MAEVQETLQLHFDVTSNIESLLTWEDWEALEAAQDGNIRVRALRPLLAKLMVDDDGKPVEFDEAMKMLGKLKVIQIPDVIKQFMTVLNMVAVPKESGNSSSPPSTPSLEEGEFPVGPAS